jgi:hypothetical protein
MKHEHDCCKHHGDHKIDPSETKSRPGQWTCPMDPEPRENGDRYYLL